MQQLNPLRVLPVLSLLLLSLRALPCSCYSRSVAEEVQDAELVLHGQVIGEKHLPDHYEFTVVVKRLYKSTLKADTLLIRTHINPALNCDAVLELNKSYLFYVWAVDAGKRIPEFRTRTCSRTKAFDAAEEKEIIAATR